MDYSITKGIKGCQQNCSPNDEISACKPIKNLGNSKVNMKVNLMAPFSAAVRQLNVESSKSLSEQSVIKKKIKKIYKKIRGFCDFVKMVKKLKGPWNYLWN